MTLNIDGLVGNLADVLTLVVGAVSGLLDQLVGAVASLAGIGVPLLTGLLG